MPGVFSIRRSITVLIVVSQFGIFFGLPAAAGASSPEREPGARVLLVGVDGASWKVIGPMIEDGELPTLARFVQKGAHCRRFDVVSPHSPVAWTSIATGRSPDDHGIKRYVSKLPDGSVVRASGNMRKTPAAWEITSRYGVSTGVVGWWATWPADEIDGYVVSDHANPALAEFMVKDGHYWTADPALLTSLQRDVFPPDIADLVERSSVTPANFSLDEYQRRARLTSSQLEQVKQAPWYERDFYSHLKSFYVMDRSTVSVARELMRDRTTDLVMVYMRGPDPVQHKAWDLVEPEKYQVPPPHLERDRGVVQAVYRYVDSFLAELVNAMGDDAWILVVSDHGAEPRLPATGKPRIGRPGAHSPAAKGVLFIDGPHVKRGFRIPAASPYDVLPTILWLMDLPVSRELEGRAMREVFASPFAERDLKSLASYGPRDTRPADRSPVDKRMLESLRSLGYID